MPISREDRTNFTQYDPAVFSWMLAYEQRRRAGKLPLWLSWKPFAGKELPQTAS